MDIERSIYGRKSIRKYSDQSISDKDMQEIMDAGLMAPSGVNYQPWYFVVLKSEEPKSRLREIMCDVSDKNLPGLKERFSKNPEVVEESCRFLKMLGNAPVYVLAFINKPGYSKKDTTIIQSVSAAIENMLLLAYGKGIGSCWITAPVEAEIDLVIRDRFAPGHGDMVALITFGYPDGGWPAAPERKEGRYTIV